MDVERNVNFAAVQMRKLAELFYVFSGVCRALARPKLGSADVNGVGSG